MDPKVAYINTLIRTVREDRGLTLSAIEITTHYAQSTIHDWEHGRGKVDPDYLSRLFQLTGDLRILQFFAPGISGLACDCSACRTKRPAQCGAGTQPVNGSAPVPPPLDLRRANQITLGAIEEFCKYAKFIDHIAADGVVCDKDDDSIARLGAHGNNVRDALTVLDRSIAYLRDQWQRQNGGRR